MNKKQLEQTLVLIKPDALKNSITGLIFSQLSEFHTGARFAAAKVVNVSRLLAEEHYAEHKGKRFYNSLLNYITGVIHYPESEKWKRRVIAIVYLGPGVIVTLRNIAGPTNPHGAREKRPGSIRSLGTVAPILNKDGRTIGSRMDNLVHTSASKTDAEREIKLWFLPSDIPPMMRGYPTAICKTHYYYKKSRLYNSYKPDSIFLLGPGDVAWKTDLDILQNYGSSKTAKAKLTTVIAKYLINRS
jgi:nucleoside-diphosphate kinase